MRMWRVDEVVLGCDLPESAGLRREGTIAYGHCLFDMAEDIIQSTREEISKMDGIWTRTRERLTEMN